MFPLNLWLYSRFKYQLLSGYIVAELCADIQCRLLTFVLEFVVDSELCEQRVGIL